MSVLIVDNYDSFTYNLLHYVEMAASQPVDVIYNDEIPLKGFDDYDHIILSPGPGLPAQAGKMPEILKSLATSKKILGVCLGHQAIAEFFGARLENKGRVHHGVASVLKQTAECLLWNNIPRQFEAGRYHSWTVSKSNLPLDLVITAEDDAGEIMAMQHRNLPIYGVQFHPESIMTPHGLQMIRNFLSL